MENSGGNHQQPGAQDEPFFDLLQQSAPVAVPTTGFPSSGHHIPKKMENSTDFHFGGDDVLSSFDFQPIRASGSQIPAGGASSSSVSRIEESRGRQGSPPSSYTSYEPMRSREPPPTYETPITRPHELEKESLDSATASAVERTMKKYADNLLRVLEGLTGRLSQLESSTQRLEHLFEEIKGVVVDTHGESDGKLRSLENHILEVQRGVQLLRDRQEIFEAQSQLAKLQSTPKSEQTTLHSPHHAPLPPSASEPPSPPSPPRAPSGKLPMETAQQQGAEAPSSYFQPQPQLQLPQMPALPAPITHQTPPPPQPQPQPQQQAPHQQQHHHQRPPQQLQLQHQHVQQPIQPNAVQSEVGLQPLHQQQPSPLPPPHAPQMPRPPHPPAPYVQQQQQQQLPPYSQQPQPQQQQAPQPPPIPNYGAPPMPETTPYGQQPQGNHPGSQVPLPPSSYPSELPSYHPSYGPPPRPPPPQQQLSQMPPPPQPQQSHNVGMYDSSPGRAGSGQLALPGYLRQGHPVSGASHYESTGPNTGGGYPSSYRVSQTVPSAPSGGGGGGYPRLPVAQPVQHAAPTGGGGSGPPPSSSSLSSNRVPVGEVIDKVTAMGFSKDMVREVVRRLTENGQSVDLNIVLDKLMNGDSAQGPPKGWFGR